MTVEDILHEILREARDAEQAGDTKRAAVLYSNLAEAEMVRDGHTAACMENKVHGKHDDAGH